MNETDDFDLAILRLMQENTRLTSEQVGEQIGLSATAVQRRLKKLRDSGLIAREIAVLSPKVTGNRMTTIVQVVMKRTGAHILDDFKRSVQDVPEIQQCYYVTGEYDFILVINTQTIADYERLTRRTLFTNPNIDKFHTIVSMENVKQGLQIPI